MPTEADVRDIYLGTSASTSAVEFWIDVAEDYVSEAYRGVAGAPTDPELDRITTLVACHFLAAQDPTEARSSIGDASHEYEGPADEAGLAETRYGRRAMSLDPTGALEAYAKPSPEFRTFGTTYDAGGRRTWDYR